jgi:xanthine dehydrogenase accessory factor
MIVAESSNSSPGRQGFKMAISENGETAGTIGGGIMEKELIDYAIDLLFGKESRQIRKLHHNPNSPEDKSGLICGGFQTMIIKVLDKNNLLTIKNILTNIKKNEDDLFLLSNSNVEFSKNANLSKSIAFVYNSDDDWEYREKLGQAESVYIIGGGHIGLAVSKIMKTLGFFITVFDHREDIFTMDENEYADKKIITNYDEVDKYIPDGDKTYIVIVTPQHSGDQAALGAVLKKNVRYLGMMGSKRKIKSIFDGLKANGATEKELSRIHTPIGLEIEAETPEEIAVSIAAEIIKTKNS